MTFDTALVLFATATGMFALLVLYDKARKLLNQGSFPHHNQLDRP